MCVVFPWSVRNPHAWILLVESQAEAGGRPRDVRRQHQPRGVCSASSSRSTTVVASNSHAYVVYGTSLAPAMGGGASDASAAAAEVEGVAAELAAARFLALVKEELDGREVEEVHPLHLRGQPLSWQPGWLCQGGGGWLGGWLGGGGCVSPAGGMADGSW